MYEIFLIHGTWSSKYVWTPALLEEIHYFLRLAGFTYSYRIHKFEWDGKFSHEHRKTAAVHLHSEMKKVTDQNPHHKIILIGHSHGGNVALLANNFKKADMLITLAMPFMGFYSKQYIKAKSAYWLNLHGEADWIQWLAGFRRKFFHRFDDSHADKNIVVPWCFHTTIEKFPTSWKIITEEMKLHFMEMEQEEK